MDEILITTIARQCLDDNDGDTFTYGTMKYKKLLVWDGFDDFMRSKIEFREICL